MCSIIWRLMQVLATILVANLSKTRRQTQYYVWRKWGVVPLQPKSAIMCRLNQCFWRKEKSWQLNQHYIWWPKSAIMWKFNWSCWQSAKSWQLFSNLYLEKLGQWMRRGCTAIQKCNDMEFNQRMNFDEGQTHNWHSSQIIYNWHIYWSTI